MLRSFMCLLLAAAAAIAGEACPPFGPSIGFAKGDPVLSIAGMRGKAVLIVFGQSWCPVCNRWTPKLIPALEQAWGDDPGVVLLLVKTDGDAAEARSYLASHGGDPARWFLAGDAGAAWVKQVMGKDELWQYALVEPGGGIVERGNAGMFQGGDGKPLRPALPESAGLRRAAAAATRLLPAEPALPPTLARAARLAEVGCFREAMAAAAAAPAADRKTFAAALQTGAAARVGALAQQLAAGGAGLMPAYVALRDLAGDFKGSDAGKQAAEAVKSVAKDAVVVRELAAERAWNAALAKVAAMPVSRREAAQAQMRGDFAKTYGDTWFAGTVGAAR